MNPIIQNFIDKNKREQKEKAEKLRIAEVKEQKQKYEQKLCDSLEMHYYPEKIVDGIRKFAEYRPEFNIKLVEEIKKIFGASITSEIIENAKILSKIKMDEMMEQHKKEEENKILLDEERKARILSRAIILAKTELKDDISDIDYLKIITMVIVNVVLYMIYIIIILNMVIFKVNDGS